MNIHLHRAFAASAAAIGLALGGCSGRTATGPATFPPDPYTTDMGSSGVLSVAVRTSPQPPARGTNDVQFIVTSVATGGPVDGLTIDVQPWMPAMNHGTSAPTVTPQGNGTYLVSEVYLYMPGVWQLRSTISGPASDHVQPELSIP
jgi:hypothetical protein